MLEPQFKPRRKNRMWEQCPSSYWNARQHGVVSLEFDALIQPTRIVLLTIRVMLLPRSARICHSQRCHIRIQYDFDFSVKGVSFLKTRINVCSESKYCRNYASEVSPQLNRDMSEPAQQVRCAWRIDAWICAYNAISFCTFIDGDHSGTGKYFSNCSESTCCTQAEKMTTTISFIGNGDIIK